MSSNNLEILIFDINNFEDEENDNIAKEKKEKDIKNKEELLSYKAITHFLENHIILDMEKEENEDYNEYSFIYQIQKGITKQCKFYLFSRVTQESFTIDSNSLLIFYDLEDENSKELSKKVIENIKKICQQDIRIYIFGIINGNKECVLDQESIINLYKEEDINIKYNQISIKEDNINKNNEGIKNDNLNDKDNNKSIENIKDEFNNEVNGEINIKNEIIKNDEDKMNNINKENIINNEEDKLGNNEKKEINNNIEKNDIEIEKLKEEEIIDKKEEEVKEKGEEEEEKKEKGEEEKEKEKGEEEKIEEKKEQEKKEEEKKEEGNKEKEKEEEEEKKEEEKKDEGNKEEKDIDIYIKIDKFIENALVDLYKYEKSKKEKSSYKEYDLDKSKYNSCFIC